MYPLVSIIIPTYNRAQIIGETLDSILDQAYTNWECLVIDDGSTDETETLINSYIKKDSRFQFHKRPNSLPKGANACRNFGFNLSRGTYINWFDSDDIMLPQKLEIQVSAFSDNKEFPYCICQSLWFDKTSNTNLGLRSKAITSNNRFEDYCLYNIFWLTTAPLWRRDFIINNSLRFDESLHQSQEYDFHIRALSISDNYIVINEPLVTIIKHAGTISQHLYSDDLKLASNLKVKKLLFDNYSNKFSSKGKLKLHDTLTLIFKELLLLKNYKQAKNYKRFLTSSLKYLNISIFKKVIFVFRLNFAFLSYLFFGRGYKLVKPLK